MNSIEWLKKLIAYDTTSRNSNIALIHAVSDWFADHKANIRLTYDESKQKANLFATLPAVDGSIQGGLILSGHTDVVPVDGQSWDTDPFKATEKNGYIFGRGTSDMKGFVAVATALLPKFQQMKLKKPLHFAFSYDEEVGCKGVRPLIADLAKAGITPDACIVGEPTEMKLVVGHKGIQGFRCRIQGLAAHSSLVHQGCNAIEFAAQVITFIRNFAEQLKKNGPQDECFDVPFTSMTTNLIQGGNALNIIPALCEFSFEFRNLVQTNPAEIIDKIKYYIDKKVAPQMLAEYPGAAIEIHQTDAVPGLETTEDAEIIQWVREITGEKDKRKVAYATEAGLFQKAGIPTIICGPGSIEQAHRANEFVALEQLKKCEEFLVNLMKKYLA